ncbi:MAG: tRNA pseudouridine(38-40) synthase TruA [Spirochaetaceae bacterium]|jgi:tRNA pseudouridine38-40 synthase|nr:tRNA pseudouridine(38-40) synthase TruA [Spirochaetaceae bacterium]
MRNIQLIIAYDGTEFSGWQRQQGVRTVQGCIEDALHAVHKHPVQLHGAGRTDAGVHAAAQSAHFFTSIASIKPENFIPALNSALPPDVRIRAAREVPAAFHARFSAKSRAYRYHIIMGMRNLPHETRYALQMRRIPDIARLAAYARLLHGEIDCSLFASPSDPIFQQGSGSKFRFIHNAAFFIEHGMLVFEICANAFFRRMVRSIVGTLLFCEEHGMSAGGFAALMQSNDHSSAGPTAIPNGLFLWQIEY